MNFVEYTSESKPSVSVIAQDEAIRNALSRVAEAAGGRLFRAMDYATALDHLEQGRPTGTLLVELGEDGGRAAEQLVDTVYRHVCRDHEAMILSGPVQTLDAMSGIGLDSRVTWLCEPSDGDRVAALALSLSQSPTMLSDVSADLDTQRLRRLADEVSRIARTLANLSGPRPSEGYAVSALADRGLSYTAEPVAEGEAAMPGAEEVRRILRLRRLRDSFFDPALFADPAWDMLLDLLAARIERAQVAVSSLCIAAAVPPTTALRWIKTMTDHGLFERCADPEDGRRIFIQLSDHAAAALSRYFAAVKRVGGAAMMAI
jgi:DNA-binding MarR family transcriptional regulator